ncbi:unnamed protein product, partial [marine sediment metagenome]
QIYPNGRLFFLDTLYGNNIGMKQLIEHACLPLLHSPKWRDKVRDWRDIGDESMLVADQSDTNQSAAKVVEKRSADVSGYRRFWEMKERGAAVGEGSQITTRDKEVFRCVCCGSVTGCKKGHDGTPDISKCTPECQADLKATRASSMVTDNYREGYPETFGHG